jgi:hypothetical protein
MLTLNKLSIIAKIKKYKFIIFPKIIMESTIKPISEKKGGEGKFTN